MIQKITSLTASLILGISFIHAQENAEPTNPSESQVSITNPKISIDVLRLRLDPLTKEEIEKEVSNWQVLLKEKATEIANLEIESLNDTAKRSNLNEGLPELLDEKSAIIKRIDLVLDAYEEKGGEAENVRKYVAAVKDIKASNNDIGLQVTTFNAWLTSQEGGIKILIQSLKLIGVIILFWILSIFASKLISRAIDKQPRLSSLLKVFINKMSRRIILAIGIIVALGTIGVNVGAALALIGGGAFILAFALQDTLSNFANGVMLIAYRPFDVGDAVELGGISGKVDSVSLVSTTILTFDNKKVLVPNKKVWGETITNMTGMANRRIDMVFGIGYDDDYEKAQNILEQIVTEHEMVLTTPEPIIRLHELADSSVNFVCRPWGKKEDYWTIYWDITKRVKKEFDAAGISIPYPQTDVHLHTVADKDNLP